jgi:hypothetical protein
VASGYVPEVVAIYEQEVWDEEQDKRGKPKYNFPLYDENIRFGPRARKNIREMLLFTTSSMETPAMDYFDSEGENLHDFLGTTVKAKVDQSLICPWCLLPLSRPLY